MISRHYRLSIGGFLLLMMAALALLLSSGLCAAPAADELVHNIDFFMNYQVLKDMQMLKNYDVSSATAPVEHEADQGAAR